MTFVTVFHRVPRPITGMIGILQDPDFERFEATLDWLETIGVLVEQFDPSTAIEEVVKRPAVQQILTAEGDRCLPLILVNEAVMSRGRYLSRGDWPAPSDGDRVGSGRSLDDGRREDTPVTAKLECFVTPTP